MIKKKAEECPTCEAWITSFADLMSLLCIFFVLLFSMANTDLKNFASVAEALRTAFNNVGGPALAVVGNAEAGSTGNAGTAAPIFSDSLAPRRRDFLSVTTELTVLANQLDMGGQISVNMALEGIIVSLSDTLAFEPGSTELLPEAKLVLDEVSKLLINNNNSVRVEGHTDDISPNSPFFQTNWDLSTARAVAIVKYLVEEGGISGNRLTAAGRAEFSPIVPNNNRENRARNRRADIIIIYPSEARRFSLPVPPSSK